MLLAIDIGNSNLSVGAFEEDRLVFVSRLATERHRTGDQYALELKSICEMHRTSPSAFDAAIIGSVVPELTPVLGAAAYTLTGCQPVILGPGLKTGLNILTDNPAQVGADLIAAAVACAAMYPLPCLAADLGTATKISIIDSKGAFCGCTIAPGVAISLEALASRTSQLPNISLQAPTKAAGKNTVDAMRSGIIFGTAAMIDGLCEIMEAELGEGPCFTVATGGLAADIVPVCKRDIVFNGELVLEGLRLVFEKNRKPKTP